MSRRRGRRRRFEDQEDVNPLNYLSNLTDVMLVLAVGIMVALIVHWNVQIENTGQSGTDTTGSGNDAVSFTQDELESQTAVPDDMTHMGEVYYDEASGTYYIIEDDAEGE